jgi:hypothetical protein
VHLQENFDFRPCLSVLNPNLHETITRLSVISDVRRNIDEIFWGITQSRMGILYRRFGTNSLPLKMGPTLRNTPEERRFHN